MKILLIAPQPFYALRGTPIAVRQVVETLCEAGHEVHLLVYHAGEDIQIPGTQLFRAGPRGLATSRSVFPFRSSSATSGS
jgi:hypothetical protein